jgi:autotransporter-associated beta strand protein
MQEHSAMAGRLGGYGARFSHIGSHVMNRFKCANSGFPTLRFRGCRVNPSAINLDGNAMTASGGEWSGPSRCVVVRLAWLSALLLCLPGVGQANPGNLILNVPDWNQPSAYGVSGYSQWCSPTAGANVMGYWEDVLGKVGLTDRQAFSSSPSYPGTTLTYQQGLWHDGMIEMGWMMDTDKWQSMAPPLTFPPSSQAGTLISNIAAGLLSYATSSWTDNNYAPPGGTPSQGTGIVKASCTSLTTSTDNVTQITQSVPTLTWAQMWNNYTVEIKAGRPVVVSFTMWVNDKGDTTDWSIDNFTQIIKSYEGFPEDPTGHSVVGVGYIDITPGFQNNGTDEWFVCQDGWDSTAPYVAFPLDSRWSQNDYVKPVPPEFTWEGGLGSDWGNPENWIRRLLRHPGYPGDWVAFGAPPSSPMVDLGSDDRSVGQVIFTAGVSTVIESTGGGTLTLDNATDVATVTAAGAHSIHAPVALNDDAQIIVPGSSDSLTIEGVIRDGIRGPKSITKGGAGIVKLNAANIYNGPTIVNAGILALNAPWHTISGGAAGTIQAGTTITVNSSATLRMDCMDTLGWYTGNPAMINLNGGTMTTGGGAFHNTLPAITLTGGTITAPDSGDGPGNYIFDGTITTNASPAQSIISAPKITLRGGNPPGSVMFQVADGPADSDLIVSSVLIGSATMVKTGAGTMVLSSNSTYSGHTTVSGGTLSLATGLIYSNFAWGDRQITVNNGATVEIGGWGDEATAGFGQIRFASENILIDNGKLRYVGGRDGGRMDRGFTIGSGGATLEVAAGIWQISQVADRPWFKIESNGGLLTLTGDGEGSIMKAIPGEGGLLKSGTGIWMLSGENTYSGDTIIEGGTLEIAGGIPANGTSLIDVQSGKVVFKAVNINKENLDINTAASATFEVFDGTHEVGDIAGVGMTNVDSGATLIASSVQQSTLSIAGGGKVVIRPIPGGPLSCRITPIPEPHTIVMLAAGAAAMLVMVCRRR